ncbi:MAG: PEP-CTERM sorting domain-containing protein [Phycisphaeraceae bacterium]|nr:PEP-CTERM sorting domain-containing protein [Phycisphaeraceae bacterium]
MFIARLHRRLGVAAAFVVLTVASGTALAAKIYPYASVSTDVAAECFPTNSLGLGDYANDDAMVTTGPIQSVYESDGWSGVIGLPQGSTGGHLWRAKAKATLDLANGIAKASAIADFRLDNSSTQPHLGAGFSNVYADVVIRDTITLSEAATVVFSGNIEGKMRAFNSHPDNQDDPDVGAAVDVKFTSDLPIPGDPDGMHETYGSLSSRFESPVAAGGISVVAGDWVINPYLNIDEPLYLAVDLPAGKSRIDISFGVWVKMILEMGPPVWSELNGDTDFGNTLTFQVIVPEGVEATSGSGLLPITVPEPTTLILLSLGGLALLRRSV